MLIALLLWTERGDWDSSMLSGSPVALIHLTTNPSDTVTTVHMMWQSWAYAGLTRAIQCAPCPQAGIMKVQHTTHMLPHQGALTVLLQTRHASL